MERLRGFIQRYGHDLFTAGFLNLANLRSVLHRGVSAWLDELPRQDYRSGDLDDKLPRAQAVRMLETVLQAVVENYDEYRDYNTTTTQSDYGENLFVLLDFLRLKTAYERDNWRMRPLVLVHEILCRRRPGGRSPRLGNRDRRVHAGTRRPAPGGPSRPGSPARDQAPDGRRPARERFVAPLAVEDVAALVGPAREAADPNGDGPSPPSRGCTRKSSCPRPRRPRGLGRPLWLRRLEVELYRLRQEPTREAPSRSRLTAEEGCGLNSPRIGRLAGRFVAGPSKLRMSLRGTIR